MLFKAFSWPGLRDGSITLTFRRWSRPQVRVGGRYLTRAAGVTLVVDDLTRVPLSDVTEDEAQRAGFASYADLLAFTKAPPNEVVWRVAFHRDESPEPTALSQQADLTPEDVALIAAKLERLDRTGGPWTETTLRLIAEQPNVRAVDLAAQVGREKAPFKADVYKLKRLGLTESLERGYRLSPRGRAYWDAARASTTTDTRREEPDGRA